jgi:hypothetical protein
MIPGIVAIAGRAANPQTFQFTRSQFNPGFVIFGNVTLSITQFVPYVIPGDRLRVDARYYQGGWCEGWRDRVAMFFTYGTPFNTGFIAGGGSKNHYVRLSYGGGTSVTMDHGYAGDSTNFKQAEITIDRLVYFDTQEGASGFFQKSLPA